MKSDLNVIFLDYDGVLETEHEEISIEQRVSILSEICKEYNCKVVISSSMKDAIDEHTLEPENKGMKYLFELFEKYDIDCIGRTSTVKRRDSNGFFPIWKEDEIRLYLFRHPEIMHYCVIDDDDLASCNSDLEKVKDHLVKTIYYSDNPEEEGLLLSHKEEVGKVLEKENEVRKLAIRNQKRRY